MNEQEPQKVCVILPPTEDQPNKLRVSVKNRFSFRESVVFCHESLSVIRKWANANGYTIDESKLVKPKKKVREEVSDEELYTYR